MKGLSEVLRNLNNQVGKVKHRTVAGLLAGGLLVQAEAQRRVPVHKGFLRGSAYTRKAEVGQGVSIGFSAAYALFVHENLEAKWRGKPRRDGTGQYWGPAGEPRFLAKAVEHKAPQVVQAVRQYAEVTR